VNQDKETSEEEEGGPFDVMERFFQFVPVGGQEHDHGANESNPGDGDVRNGVKEEVENHENENKTCNFEHLRVFDAVLGLQFSNITNP
jgi:hypothetical protein